MRFGLDVPVSGDYADPRLLGDLAAEAEASGWDGFFLQDTLSLDAPACDPWLTAVALRTERIRIGVLMTALSRRRPWLVARQAVTVDRLSGGRLVFGAALGYTERDFTPFGEEWGPRLRAERLDEALEVIAGLWGNADYSFSGSHYRLDHAVLLPGPQQSPRIPVWTAAGWPKRRPLRRAARWDGVYLMTVHQETGDYLTPSDVADAVAFAQAQRGPSPAAFDVALNPPPGGSARMVGEYADAGATWWLELDDEEAGPSSYRRRIIAGPPA